MQFSDEWAFYFRVQPFHSNQHAKRREVGLRRRLNPLIGFLRQKKTLANLGPGNLPPGRAQSTEMFWRGLHERFRELSVET